MFVYTIQPVVKPVWQLVVSCIQTFNQLSMTTRLTNGYIVYIAGCQTGCTTGWTNSGCLFNTAVKPVWQPAVSCVWTFSRLTTGCMFVYTIQPVVKPVVQPVVSCKRGIMGLLKQTMSANQQYYSKKVGHNNCNLPVIFPHSCAFRSTRK